MTSWPWRNNLSGTLVWPELWYGFTRTGHVCSPYKGCRSEQEAIAWVKEVLDTTPSTNIQDIGVKKVVVCTGRQYIDYMSNHHPAQLAEYGHFIGATNDGRQ